MEEDFFKNLKRIRKLRSKTQQEMAASLGISMTQYQNYEANTLPPHDKLIKINEILGEDLSRFIYQGIVGNDPKDINSDVVLKKLEAIDEKLRLLLLVPQDENTGKIYTRKYKTEKRKGTSPS